LQYTVLRTLINAIQFGHQNIPEWVKGLRASLKKNGASRTTDVSNARTSRFATASEWIALATSIIASLILLGWVMQRCHSGFDFTDEGFYLNWISNPAANRGSVSQFGFVYHPLYEFVAGDVALLRQCNVLIIFALAFGLCNASLRSCWGKSADHRLSQRAGLVGIAAIVASGSLAFFDMWLPTPSYNSLNFQSLMLAATGVLLAGGEQSKRSFVGWILIGIGGGFAFLAKPTSAAMLGFVVAVYLVVAGKFRLRGLSLSIAVAVASLIVSALAIDGSLVGFVRRIADGLDMGSRLASGHGLIDVIRWDDINLSNEQKSNFTYLLIVTFAATILGFLASDVARFGAASITITISALVVATIAGVLSPHISYEPFQPVQFSAVSFGIALAAMMFPTRYYRWLSRNGIALIIFFAVLPYAYAFGTSQNYWAAAARAGLFWYLAGFIICAEFAMANLAWHNMLPAAAGCLLVSTGVLYTSMNNPYRQVQPLRLQTNLVEIIPGKSKLFLSDETAAYVRRLARLSNENGFRAGNTMLDMTGVSPGSLYVAGARPLGLPWTLGGYPGSKDYLTAALDKETCEAIAASWILTEPGSRDTFSSELLRQFGSDVATDYLNVGSIASTRSFSPQKFEQQLLKPARSLDEAKLSCENARRMRMK
jgi:hypothetical protein